MAGKYSDTRLPTLFDQIWFGYQHLEETKDPTNSDDNQNLVAKSALNCEASIAMVNELSLFSSNESIDDVSTNELRYMLLSALLGYFTIKRSSTSSTRLPIVLKAKAYFRDFIKLCNQYGLTDRSYPDSDDDCERSKDATSTSRSATVQDQARQRAGKIQKYKEDKESEARLKELYSLVNRDHVDDEVKREYYMALLKKFISSSIDEINSIKEEIQILKFMAEQSSSETSGCTHNSNNIIKRPFILTKNDIEKKVFGTGYPSLPTMTVDEFYEQNIKDTSSQAREPVTTIRNNSPRDDQDDDETLQRLRSWDDWKDDHKRGEGNRQNMG